MWRLRTKRAKGILITVVIGIIIFSGWCIYGYLQGKLLQWLSSPLFISVALCAVVVLAFFIASDVKKRKG